MPDSLGRGRNDKKEEPYECAVSSHAEELGGLLAFPALLMGMWPREFHSKTAASSFLIFLAVFPLFDPLF